MNNFFIITYSIYPNTCPRPAPVQHLPHYLPQTCLTSPNTYPTLYQTCTTLYQTCPRANTPVEPSQFSFQNRKENCHHDHIPFNVTGNGNIVLSVQYPTSQHLPHYLPQTSPNTYPTPSPTASTPVGLGAICLVHNALPRALCATNATKS